LCSFVLHKPSEENGFWECNPPPASGCPCLVFSGGFLFCGACLESRWALRQTRWGGPGGGGSFLYFLSNVLQFLPICDLNVFKGKTFGNWLLFVFFQLSLPTCLGFFSSPFFLTWQPVRHQQTPHLFLLGVSFSFCQTKTFKRPQKKQPPPPGGFTPPHVVGLSFPLFLGNFFFGQFWWALNPKVGGPPPPISFLAPG